MLAEAISPDGLSEWKPGRVLRRGSPGTLLDKWSPVRDSLFAPRGLTATSPCWEWKRHARHAAVFAYEETPGLAQIIGGHEQYLKNLEAARMLLEWQVKADDEMAASWAEVEAEITAERHQAY